MGDIHDIEDRKLSGLRKDKDDLTNDLRKTRVKIRSGRNQDKEMTKVAVMVHKLQMTLSDINAFQDKSMNLLRDMGTNPAFSQLLMLIGNGKSRDDNNEFSSDVPPRQDQIVWFSNNIRLRQASLMREKMELLSQLDRVKAQMKAYLHSVK